MCNLFEMCKNLKGLKCESREEIDTLDKDLCAMVFPGS